jgi:hypothetical protein
VDGRDAAARVIDDGNALGVLRLTVDHFIPTATDDLRSAMAKHVGEPGRHALPGIAISVRVRSGLDDGVHSEWAEDGRGLRCEVSGRAIRLEATGEGAVARLVIEDPWAIERSVASEPKPPRGVLSINGEERGRAILESLPAIRAIVDGKSNTGQVSEDAK